MKKFLMFLTIFLTSIIFTNCVSAKNIINESITINNEYNFYNYEELTEEEKSNLDISENIEFLKDYFNKQTKYDSYFIINGLVYYGTEPVMIMFNKENAYNKSLISYSSSDLYLTILFNEYNSNSYISINSKIYGKSISHIYSNIKYNNNSYKYFYARFKYESFSDYYFSSNYINDIVYTTEIPYLTAASSNYTDRYSNVYYNDTLLFSEGQSALKTESKFGQIEIENNYSGEDIYSVNIKLPVSNYDENKYIYQYQKSTDSEWHDLNDYYNSSTSSFDNIFYENGTWFFKILDIEGNYLSSTSLTISKISEISSYLTFDLETPDFCKLNIENVEYTTCKYLNIYTHNVLEYSKAAYYSYDTENWTIFYSDKSLIVSENSPVYFKLVNLNDNSILSTYTFNVVGIDENLPSIKENSISFKSNLSSSKTYSTISVIFYNVDTTLYNYYFTTDFENWLDVTNKLENNDKYSKKYVTNIYSNMTIGAKVTDKDGNYLSSATFTITDIQESSTSIIENLKNSFNKGIFDSFTAVYNKIRNEKLGQYLFIVIIGSILILYIKSMKK